MNEAMDSGGETMNAARPFSSDWQGWMSGAWKWLLEIVNRPYEEWRSRDWHRLADIYAFSDVTAVLEFDSLHGILRSKRSVPDKKTLLRIGDWKAPRSKRWLRENGDQSVADATRRAFALITRDSSLTASIRAMETLWDDDKGLYGIGVPVASTLLTMFDPDYFGVIDTYAWYCLFGKRGVQTSSLSHWRDYLPQIQALAKQHSMRCRDVDAVLWYVGQLRDYMFE